MKTNICFPEEMKQGDVILCHPARGWLSRFCSPLKFSKKLPCCLKAFSYMMITLLQNHLETKSRNSVIFNTKKYKLFEKFF